MTDCHIMVALWRIVRSRACGWSLPRQSPQLHSLHWRLGWTSNDECQIVLTCAR
eukprot:NODE_29368_length_448_cov_2.009346.p2 GENE.NODE_29368_length_448_cov_2.009346~~NODE_29368_length_448_cov_2.009346.p2  ORF type:complete len:54 (+),score=7.35 NODE_29368_length_448_cov_2.009346:249-410(+)